MISRVTFSHTTSQYINAEATAGGIAHWATSEVAGKLRTNASDWKAAWQDYIHGFIDVTVPNQISNGGPVIGKLFFCAYIFPSFNIHIAVQVDNEFGQDDITQAEYFVDLENVYHNSEIVVPLTYNDPGMGRSFINGTVSM